MFATLKEAVTWRTIDQFDAKKKRVVSAYTIKNLVDEWLEFVKVKHAKGTFDLYERDSHHFKSLYDIAVEDLLAEDLDRWIKNLIDPNYPKSKTRTSFQREVELLTTVLNWYRERKNPRYQHPVLKRHSSDSFFVRRLKQKKIPLTEEQLENVLEHMKIRSKRIYYYLASLQALSGLRIGEACALKWSDIDFENQRLTVQRIVCWEVRTKSPYLRDGTKTNEVRTVKLCERAIELLKEMKENHQDEHLFRPNGTFPRYSAIQNAYNRVFMALDLPQRSTHIYRHTFATLHADQTKDIRATQSAMGHNDLRVTQHYANASERTQANALSDFRTGRARKSLDMSPNVSSTGTEG